MSPLPSLREVDILGGEGRVGDGMLSVSDCVEVCDDEYTDQIGVRLYLLCILYYTEFGWIYVREVGRTDSRDCRTGKVPCPAVLGRLVAVV